MIAGHFIDYKKLTITFISGMCVTESVKLREKLAKLRLKFFQTSCYQNGSLTFAKFVILASLFMEMASVVVGVGNEALIHLHTSILHIEYSNSLISISC